MICTYFERLVSSHENSVCSLITIFQNLYFTDSSLFPFVFLTAGFESVQLRTSVYREKKITAKSASMYADRPFTNLADNLVRKFAIRSDLQFQEQFFVFFQCFEIDIYLGKVDDRFKMNVRTCGSFVRCLSNNYIRRLLTLS